MDGEKLNTLITAAADARKNAYCPYSHFRVGSAILCEDGQVFSGCNIENVSYGATVCAERVAIFNAVSSGNTKFKAMAICCDIIGKFKGPCGMCRQALIEFGNGCEIYLVKPENKEWMKVDLDFLLPMAFTPRDLEAERIQT